MSQGNDFASYAGSADGQATPSSDVWFVAVASDDIKQMNVDQLDEAFRLGIISAETAVWTEGMEAWAPLGEVADLGGDDDAEEPSAEPESVQPPPEFNAAPGAGGGFGASFAAGPSSVAPVTASFAPGAPNPSPFVQSTVPVALNVDEDMPPIRVGRSWRPARWLLAVAAIAGLGVTAYNSGILASEPAPVAAAAAQPVEAKPVSRAYDVGDGVEKGSSLPATAAVEDAPSSAKAADGDEPIGASSALAAKQVPAEAAEAEAVATPPKKESLKGNFTKAFNKKSSAKPRASKSRAKARKAPVRASKASSKKKAGAPKAASAFDPLNDSLP